MDAEAAFEIVGAFGRYQAFMFAIFTFMNMYGAWHMILLVFVGATPVVNETKRGRFEAIGMKTIVNEWNLFGDREYIVQLIQSVFMLGVLVGNLSLGQLSDRIGRRPVLFKGIFFHAATAFIAGFATDYRVFTIFRFLTGICQGGLLLAGFVLQQELLGSSVWTITGSIPAAAFAVGIMELSWISSWFSDWQSLCITTALPGILICLCYFVVPESPRWLYSQGRISEAEEVMRYLAKKNGVLPSQVNSIVLEKKVSHTGDKSHNKSYSIKDLFSTKEMMKRTLIMAYVWFVCSLTYYGITMASSDLGNNLHISVMLSGLVELPGYAVSIYFLSKHWAGRRRTLALSLIISGVSCLCIMILPNPAAKSTPKLVLALLGKLCISSGFSILYIYAAELFPTVIRNVGMGTSSMCARVGGIFAPVVPMLAHYGASLPYIVYGTGAVVAGAISFQLVETLNQKIPDTIDDIDGSAKAYMPVNSKKKKLFLTNNEESDKAGLLANEEMNEEI